MIAGVAAGHPATAAAGVEILADGGSAADAAVAASLASCVAETVMTGLLGGGHAIHFDGARAEHLDGFCAIPERWGPSGSDLVHLEVPFGAELVHYAIGPASCAVPGVPALLGELHARHGRLPWARLCEPALRLAREGVAMPPAHVACLAMLEPVMTLREGARLYAPGGSLLRPGETLQQPGLVAALESLAAEGAAGAYTGTVGAALLALSDERGGLLTRADLSSYRAEWHEPVETAWRGRRVLTRGGLSGVGALHRFATPGRLALVEALDVPHDASSHTTNLVAVDAAGTACVVTTSLGLGSGDWLPGLDLHLNSMLGEADLLRGDLVPGARMESMMAPTVVLDAGGLELAAGAAGGTRLRTALLTVLAGVVDDGLEPQAAIEEPRIHPAGDVVNAEPGADEATLTALEERGRVVRRWLERHHYFGGVSAIGRSGAGADPRRSGAALPAP